MAQHWQVILVRVAKYHRHVFENNSKFKHHIFMDVLCILYTTVGKSSIIRYIGGGYNNTQQ